MNEELNPPLRENRSFVIREGRFTEGQKKALEQLWPQLGIDVGQLSNFDLNNYFTNSQPLILDIGFGSGDSLISLAQQRSDLNFIGVEVYRPGIGAVLRRIKEHKLQNVRVMNVDAMQLIAKIAPSSLAGVMIWFPDPWPKKRHHKRRLVQESFLIELAKAMQTQAILHLASDWQPYVEFMQAHLAKVKAFRRLDTNQNPLKLKRPPTRFEQRGLRIGHKVCDLIYQLDK